MPPRAWGVGCPGPTRPGACRANPEGLRHRHEPDDADGVPSELHPADGLAVQALGGGEVVLSQPGDHPCAAHPGAELDEARAGGRGHPRRTPGTAGRPKPDGARETARARRAVVLAAARGRTCRRTSCTRSSPRARGRCPGAVRSGPAAPRPAPSAGSQDTRRGPVPRRSRLGPDRVEVIGTRRPSLTSASGPRYGSLAVQAAQPHPAPHKSESSKRTACARVVHASADPRAVLAGERA